VFSIPQPVRADTAANPLFTEAPYGAIASQGELGRRLRLSFRRLEKYTPKVALAGNEGWPGDREGRAILGGNFDAIAKST